MQVLRRSADGAPFGVEDSMPAAPFFMCNLSQGGENFGTGCAIVQAGGFTHRFAFAIIAVFHHEKYCLIRRQATVAVRAT